ncbi:hypothetical protein CRENBAI_016771 [Crenichthys baileyi]|uniref:Uncharacterized protein n=1 Tax=Crenichthys baileyi TaxID=28760 RepID=A0AAV9SPS4_9TELE
MSVILGARGILTALGQYSAVTASQRVSLPRLKKDESSHLQPVVIYSFKQQCHNQRRFRDREMGQTPSPSYNPSNPAHWQERKYKSSVFITRRTHT